MASHPKNLEEENRMKKHWKLSLLLLVLLVGVAGATLWFTVGRNWIANQSTGDAYTAYVQDEKGTSLEKVYVMLCAEDGTEITWLPYVTNTSGKVQFVEGVEEGCYVKVVGVPLGYKLDESVKYKFDESKNVKITLVEDDSVYVAKIDETKFMSFSSALSVANASSEDVTIELMADAVINTGTVKNAYGKTIIVNGNGHTVTTEGGNNAFLVNQEEGLVAFENMNIVHKNTGATFQVNALVTLSLTDVSIDATKGSAYNYALINTLAVDGTTTLNMTRVDVKMAVQTPAKANEAGIIRTGNTSGTKTVNINLTECNFDTEEATGRQCIVVMKNTVANIKATKCSFKAGDSPAIWAAEQSKMQTLVMNGSKAVSTISPSSAAPIKGYAAMIGNTYYLTFAHAAEVAAKSKSDVTIKAVTDVTMKTCTIKNEQGKLITIDGNSKTITTSGGSNAFVLGNNVAFKNMTINHKNTGSVFQMTSATNLKATDVTINATEGDNYNYTLVNTLAEGETTVDFKRVNVKMAVEKKGSDKYASIIRTGNETEKKTVVIKLADCNFDTTGATGRSGIAIVPNTKATVELKNTTITTMDNFAIRSNEQDIIWNNADTKLTSLQKEYQDYPVEYYLAKIGDVFYTLKQAIAVANAAKVDTQINLLANYTIKNYKINNAAGKLITLDGCDHTITTSGGNHAFEIGNNIALKNMKIVHKNYGSAVQVASAGNVTLSKVELDATSPSNTYTTKNKENIKNTYTYALINVMAKGETNLTLSEVNVAMAVAGIGQVEGQSAILRTGNSGDAKSVNMTLQNCNFDATQATDRNGILIMKGTDADIELTNTSIKTLDVAPIKNLNTVAGTAIVNEELLTVKAKAYTGKQLTGYTIKIGETWYASYGDVLDVAKTATEDVVIVLTKDTEYDLSTLVNVHGKKITIDTNGYALTALTENEAVNIISKDKLEVDGKILYTTFKKALELVKEKGTIKLLQDVTESSGDVALTVKKVVTIDGAGKKVVSEPGVNNLFQTEKDVTFKNMIIEHNGSGAALKANKASTLTAIDVTINAKNPGTDGYKYALINVTAKQEKEDAEIPEITLDFTRVNVTMAVDSKGSDSCPSVIRTGNNNEVKNVTINLKACNIDATGAVERYGIVVMNGTTSEITLDEGTKVLAGAVSAIRTYNEVDLEKEKAGKLVILNGSKIDSEKAQFQGYKFEINNVVYEDGVLEEVTKDIKDAKVTMYDNIAKDLSKLKDGVIIDTNRYTLTATKTNDKVTIENHEVQAEGDNGTIYATFKNALKHVKENGTITLVQDIEESNPDDAVYEIKKSMTIDGDGHTIKKGVSSESKKHFFIVAETVTDLTFKNATLVHESHGLLVQLEHKTGDVQDATVKFEDMTIHAEQLLKEENANGLVYHPSNEYALINILRTGKTDLTMDNVNVKMVMPEAGKDTNVAVIRTGNATEKKDVNITLNSCSIDTSKAIGRHVITVIKNTKATIELKDTTIDTRYVSAIKNMSLTGTAKVPEDGQNKNEINVGDDATRKFEGYTKIKGLYYAASAEGKFGDDDCGKKSTEEIFDLAKTITDSEKPDKVFTIVMHADVEYDLSTLNEGRHPIIIDINGYTLTTTGDKAPGVTIVNNNTEEKQKGFEVLKTIDNDMTHYTSTEGAKTIKKNYEAQIKQQSVTVLYDKLGNALIAVKDVEDVNEVTMLKDAKAHLADVMNVTIYTNGNTLTATGKHENVEVDSEAKLVIEGKTLYTTFKKAATKANEAKEPVTIQVLKDVTIEEVTISNAEGHKIILEGNEKTFTSSKSSSKNAFVVGQNTEFRNMTIKHNAPTSAIQVTTAGSVKATDVTILANEGTNYNYALVNVMATGDTTLDFTRVKVTMTAAAKDGNTEKSIIRTGNNGQEKSVTINLTDCELDATGADKRHGIVVMNSTTAKITLDEKTTIKTNNIAAIKTLHKVGEDEESGWIIAPNVENITVSSASVPKIDGYKCQIDNQIFEDYDLSQLKGATEHKTLTMWADLQCDLSQVVNEQHGVTIYTKGHVLKTTTNIDELNNVTVDSEVSVSDENGIIAYASLDKADNVETSDDVKEVVITLRKSLTTTTGYTIDNQAGKKVKIVGKVGEAAYTITPEGAGVKAVFTVNQTGDVTFENVTINAGDATGCKGILIKKGGKITLDNPKITTKDALGVDNQSTTAIVKRNGGSIECTEVKLKVGSDVYTTYEKALTKAKTATQDVAVELWSDISENVEARKIQNNQAMITIDGNSCSFTLGETSKNAFDVYTKTTFKDIIIDYSGKGAVIRVSNPVDTSLTNVDINATTTEANILNKDEYYRGTINLLASGEYKLTLADVNIIAEDIQPTYPNGIGLYKDKSGDQYRGIIVTGNSLESQSKILLLKLVIVYWMRV